jgi:type IV pilus assembly protein PilW
MAGFGLLELMLAMGLGLIVTAGLLVIFLAEQQVYNNSSAQSLMQDSDNAISAVITPVARGVGFMGCGALNSSNGVLSYNSSPHTPLTFNTSSAVQGYTGTLPASLSDNAADDDTASDWTPSLDSSITSTSNGGPEKGSDIVVLIGAAPNATPVGVTAPIVGSPISINDGSQFAAINSGGAQMVAVSDCLKSSVFQAAGVSGTTLTYSSGPSNTPSYQAGAQVIPLQQTMFFVAKGDGGQSALYEGVMTIPSGGSASTATWTVNEMVPGVLAMKVLYGIGTNETATQYVDASEVGNWSNVTSIKLGFLVEGGVGSATMPSAAWSYPLFDSTISISVPADTRMRHVFYMTINTRNATLL